MLTARTMPYIAGRGANLQLAKSCAGRTYFIRGLLFRRQCRMVCSKEIAQGDHAV
ncbi:hypothetical protein HMPREF9303_2391 [Prevotella denticola CRIS 18C-A]|uniref:Uncharacterized protein n=1 Tax=Prevotella denticola CRIS 18C-A TaxID=944557 RepID=F0H606_9BACT|nr:hypothetical protein HMPREF9303_2391 [Prevotella denticola CRIS 18C-A]